MFALVPVMLSITPITFFATAACELVRSNGYGESLAALASIVSCVIGMTVVMWGMCRYCDSVSDRRDALRQTRDDLQP